MPTDLENCVCGCSADEHHLEFDPFRWGCNQCSACNGWMPAEGAS